MTVAEIRAALTDVDAVALTLWGEARNEPIESIVAVANVIAHRRAARMETWKAIVHRRAQFSCWWSTGGAANKLNAERVYATARQLVDGDAPTAAAWIECRWVAEGIVAGRPRDNVKGARHYCTTVLLKSAPPAWTKGRTPAVTIGAHAFFVGVP